MNVINPIKYVFLKISFNISFQLTNSHVSKEIHYMESHQNDILQIRHIRSPLKKSVCQVKWLDCLTKVKYCAKCDFIRNLTSHSATEELSLLWCCRWFIHCFTILDVFIKSVRPFVALWPVRYFFSCIFMILCFWLYVFQKRFLCTTKKYL